MATQFKEIIVSSNALNAEYHPGLRPVAILKTSGRDKRVLRVSISGFGSMVVEFPLGVNGRAHGISSCGIMNAGRRSRNEANTAAGDARPYTAYAAR